MKEAVCYNILYLLYSFLSFLTSLIIYFCISFLLLLWHQWSSSVSKFFIVTHNHSTSATHIFVLFIYNQLPLRVVFSIVNFILYLLWYKYIVLVIESCCLLTSTAYFNCLLPPKGEELSCRFLLFVSLLLLKYFSSTYKSN